ncbi:MAG: hypothetical protein AAGF78_14825 [Pseudomonadota bacterium]
MFTVIKWFFRLPWYLWLMACAAFVYFAWAQYGGLLGHQAEHARLVDEPFEAPAQTLGSFDPALIGPQGEVVLTAQIDWDEYYELTDSSTLLPFPTYGYMLFRPGATYPDRIAEGFVHFPFHDEDAFHAYLDGRTVEEVRYGIVAELEGSARLGNPALEKELRETAEIYDVELADDLVFLDAWPDGYATAAGRQIASSHVMVGLLATGAFVTFVLTLISGVSRLVFGKRNRPDPTALVPEEPDTLGKKAKRAGTAFGVAKTAGDFVLGGDDAGSGIGDLGIMDELADYLGPAGVVLRMMGKKSDRKTPMPDALDPVTSSHRRIGKHSARTARLMAGGGGEFMPEPGPGQSAAEPSPPAQDAVGPKPVAKPTARQELSFKQMMKSDPYARLADV